MTKAKHTRTSLPPSDLGIRVRGAREHNLRDIDVVVPHGSLTVVTGVSGSGKSSLAFDTIHAEGQRRYLEGLAPRLRRLLGRRTRPDVDGIDGLPPTLAVSQLASPPGSRSTVGTLSEVQDLLRLLYARAGTVHCPGCGRPVTKTEPARIVSEVLERPEGSKFLVLAPLVGYGRLDRARRQGFVRARLDGRIVLLEDVGEEPTPDAEMDVVVDRLKAGPDLRSRLQDSVETALATGGGRVRIADPDGGREVTYSEDYRCAGCDIRIETPSAGSLSFNSPSGACPQCDGLGEIASLDGDLLFPDRSRPLEDALRRLARRLPAREGKEIARTVRAFARGEGLDLAAPIAAFDATTWSEFLGTEILPWLEQRRAARTGRTRRVLDDMARREPCAACEGTRLRPEARAVRLDGMGLDVFSALSLRDARERLDALPLPPDVEPVAAPVLEEVRARLDLLLELGLEHLTLDRRGPTLSGGETQRIRLGTRLGSDLVGVLYVLDEPTAGLHPEDTAVLVGALRRLRDRGNTLIVVEHDAAVVAAADHLIEIGPGAGRSGGEVVAAAPRDAFLASEALTARALRGELVTSPTELRPAPALRDVLILEGASQHNLRGIDVRFPLNSLIAVSGVSGSGKSTLARDVLLRALRARLHGDPARPGAFDRLSGEAALTAAVEIAPVRTARSLRSVPATAAGLFGPIRRLFAETQDARMRGYGPERFSFNRKGGRCEACQGLGERVVAMEFLPDVRVTCDLCGGRRYDPETLEVRFRGLDISEVLALTVEEARPIFRGFPRVDGPLDALERVGLGYVPLGQPGRSLSGGEMQRLRLAVELARPASGPTLYVLDEPTSGLHPVDVARLLSVLRALVERGHTVVVVEHDLDVIRGADWVVDLGPGGGPRGGGLVVEGTPDAVVACPDSRTGRHLKRATRTV